MIGGCSFLFQSAPHSGVIHSEIRKRSRSFPDQGQSISAGGIGLVVYAVRHPADEMPAESAYRLSRPIGVRCECRCLVRMKRGCTVDDIHGNLLRPGPKNQRDRSRRSRCVAVTDYVGAGLTYRQFQGKTLGVRQSNPPTSAFNEVEEGREVCQKGFASDLHERTVPKSTPGRSNGSFQFMLNIMSNRSDAMAAECLANLCRQDRQDFDSFDPCGLYSKMSFSTRTKRMKRKDRVNRGKN